MRFRDLSGQKFGRLTVISRASAAGKTGRWHCRCYCGVMTIIRYGNLTSGNTRSCGCLRAERDRSDLVRHGYYRRGKENRTYRIWIHMRNRTLHPANPDWRNYGGRGIKICPRWVNLFENFLADMGEAPPGLSIDRINNDGDYAPDNCRWATPLMQVR